ncbi:hypothetical protein [Flectobacillus major]|uniref:hypothetical protein n=1 Tax=Flectobacillus major TaxID=103 RepID=UPI000401AF6E|nr:hypothetical protein [Flectobacillus major]
MYNQNEIGLAERFVSPTPKVFSIIRNIGIILAALAGAIMTIGKDIELPAILTLIADKATVIAGVISAIIAQLTVDYSEKNLQDVGKDKRFMLNLAFLIVFSFSIFSCSPIVRGRIIKLENTPKPEWKVTIENSGKYRTLSIQRAEWIHLKIGQLFYAGK